jgi:hypothetical protein
MREVRLSHVMAGGGLYEFAHLSGMGKLKRLRRKRGRGVWDWMKEHPKTTAALGWTGIVLGGNAIGRTLDSHIATRALERRYDMMEMPATDWLTSGG